MKAPALELRDVVAAYADAPRPALDGVSLTLEAGSQTSVLGPNGAGKSTLLALASGLLHPRSGEVRLGGVPIAELSRRDVARRLAVVTQASPLPEGFTVREVVELGRAPHLGRWLRLGARDGEVVDRAMERCDLVALAGRRASELSGGEQKRVAIARALAQEPEVLLLDEPGAFLDVRHQLDIHELVAVEAKERGVACLAVMHDLTLAAEFSDRVLLLKGGRSVASGTIEEVMTYRTLSETFSCDLYCGVIELTGTRYFLPMRGR